MPSDTPNADLAARLRALMERATPGPWFVATYCLWPGTPAQVERGMLMHGNDNGDDVSPTGIIDENDMPGIGSDSVSHDLDLITELRNNLPAILAALTPSAPGSGTGWRNVKRDAWNEAIEAAAKVADPGRKPCACIKMDEGGYWQQSCDCSNSGDLAEAQSWCSYANTEVAIRALRKPSPPGASEEDGR